MYMWQQLLHQLTQGNERALARAISFIENEQEGYEALLQALPANESTKMVGITGPPGAGKSTLVDRLIGCYVQAGKKVAVLCVDPSSPFNLGAVLGDRIRMSDWYLNPNVFIRSLATRGSMGGLHPKIIEITELVKAASFDVVLIETVGVGQSEIEIVGLADITVVVLVPEAGDEIQTMKAGLMEIADIFVVNKSDRPDADLFVKNLRTMLAPSFYTHQHDVPIVKTIASTGMGLDELFEKINRQPEEGSREKHYWLLAERVYYLISQKRMKDIDRHQLADRIKAAKQFNLYQFIAEY
jgi:LAO/AO transport system kinase